MWRSAQRQGELGGHGQAFPRRAQCFFDSAAIEPADLRSVQSKAPQMAEATQNVEAPLPGGRLSCDVSRPDLRAAICFLHFWCLFADDLHLGCALSDTLAANALAVCVRTGGIEGGSILRASVEISSRSAPLRKCFAVFLEAGRRLIVTLGLPRPTPRCGGRGILEKDVARRLQISGS